MAKTLTWYSCTMMESVKGDTPDMMATIIALLAYHHDVKNWFLQVESIFSMLRIISQGAKFANVMQRHPSDMMDKISDVLADLPEQKSYKHLKEAILKHTGRSEEDMILEILQNVTRGDKMPTQLLQYMKNQLGKHVREGSTWFMAGMLTQIGYANYRPSDKSHTSGWFGRVRRPSFHPDQSQRKRSSHLTQWRESSTNSVWQQVLANLQRQVWKIQISLHQQTRRPTPSRRQQRAPSRGRWHNQYICWFHHTFGNEASNCRPPCMHSSAQGNE